MASAAAVRPAAVPLMNLTLSVDDWLVERARAVARQQGTSLNALIRDCIEGLAGQVGDDES